MCVIVGLTTVDKLEVFYINFCCFSNRNVSFFATNNAMASSCKGALQLIHKCGFWNDDPDFTLVFQKPSVYRAPFPMTSTFTGSRYDVIGLSPLGSAASDSWIHILKGWTCLYLVPNSNITYTVHRFRDHSVLFSARNDVTLLTPPEGAASCQFMRILKEPPRLYICIQW